MKMITSKLEQAKEYLGSKYVLHPQYKPKPPGNNYQSRVLKDIIVTARKKGRI